MFDSTKAVCSALAPLAIAAVVITGTAAEAAASTFRGCGFYVIMGCTKSQSGARRIANGGPVVRTNDYPNFRNGWYCAAEGPFASRYKADSFLFQVEGSIPDAYVKNGC